MDNSRNESKLAEANGEDVAPPAYLESVDQPSNAGVRIYLDARGTDTLTAHRFLVRGSNGPSSREIVYNIQAKEDESTTITSTSDSSGHTASFVLNSNSVGFKISVIDGQGAEYDLKNPHLPRFHSTDINLLLKDMAPLQIQLYMEKSASSFVWRTATSNDNHSNSQPTSSRASANVDLALLDKEYRQVAYFVNEFESAITRTLPSVDSSDKQYLCGTLSFKQQIGDESFMQQVTLSLLTLIEAYRQLVQRSEQKSDKVDSRLRATGALCNVM